MRCDFVRWSGRHRRLGSRFDRRKVEFLLRCVARSANPLAFRQSWRSSTGLNIPTWIRTPAADPNVDRSIPCPCRTSPTYDPRYPRGVSASLLLWLQNLDFSMPGMIHYADERGVPRDVLMLSHGYVLCVLQELCKFWLWFAFFKVVRMTIWHYWKLSCKPRSSSLKTILMVSVVQNYKLCLWPTKRQCSCTASVHLTHTVCTLPIKI